jgi:WD40 repeat protein
MLDLSWKGVAPATYVADGHKGVVWCITFSPCGKRLASLGNDETIRVWDASTGNPLLNPIDCLSSYWHIIFSPDGILIVAYRSYDGSLRVWNTDT